MTLTLTGAGTLTADGGYPVRNILALTGAGTLTAVTHPSGHRRRTLVTRTDGTPVVELAEALHGDITLTLNDINTGSLTVPPGTTGESSIRAHDLQEVQMWRGNQLLLWGPMSRPQTSPSGTSVDVSGAEWYMGRRNVGRSPRQNYVRNNGFTDGLRYWGVGADVLWKSAYPSSVVTRTVVADPVIGDNRTVKLTCDTALPQAWLYQKFLWTVPTDLAEGETWSARAYCYIPSADYVGPSEHDRLLTITRGSTTEPSPFPAVLALAPGTKKTLDIESATQASDFPMDQWVAVEATLTQPLTAGAVESITIELSCVHGWIYWTLPTLHRSEALRYHHTDQVSIMRYLVEHAQDTAYGKSAVNLHVTGPQSGRKRDRIYLFDEHPNILDSLNEFTGLDHGVDWRGTYTPHLRHISVSSPRAGRSMPGARFDLGGEASSIVETFDGERATTTAIVLGEGTGASREEGMAVTTGIGPDTVVLEDVEVAAPETKVDGLPEQAGAKLDAQASPVVVEVTTVPNSRWLGVIWPGDIVTVNTSTSRTAGSYRIVSLTIHSDDSMTFTGNREAA